MTSSRRPGTSKPWLSSKTRALAAAGVTLFLCLNAALLGMSDDEAYYWVLAQDPSLGYAFHPPMIAWVIAAFERLGAVFGLTSSPFLVRLPACLFGGLIFWFASAQIRETRDGKAGLLNLSALTSFFGIAWMMVPDLPLFLGFILLYVGTSQWVSERGPLSGLALMILGTGLALLSKISGVLMVGSAGLAVLMLGSTSRSKKWGIAALVLGSVIGLLPTVIWNANHDWVSILYQVRDRQAGSFSIKRGLSFWLIQLALVGPALFWVLRALVKNKKIPHEEKRWNWIWILPPLIVFGLQPFKAPFKLHWSLAFWFPVLLAWLRNSDVLFTGRTRKWVTRFHRGWGFAVLLVVLLPLHIGMLPVLEWVTGRTMDPKMDVSTDFMGWSHLPNAIRILEEESQILHGLPIVGSRYQTAAQAAFAMKSIRRVTLLPRDHRQRSDWPDLNLTKSLGPGWSALKRPVLFVADQRYAEGPKFPGATCTELPHVDTERRGRVVKRIFLWSCIP